ncbi:Uncharacterized protein SCG7086_AJ_00010 [Chlamydiales bacterium SCGC AG-110-P3]|nr:Uncharacterized protein SCG7086_AJ_00010 [Chlamydiales bacterium SCGC AG-110-P3]
MSNIDIILPTYNGGQYLAGLLQSLFDQSNQNFRILVRDDQSSDDTSVILHRWAQSHPNRIIIVPSNERKGVIGNVSELLQAATASYVMLCDQDDIWLPNKIEQTLALMKKIEETHSSTHPILVHTDLHVVDSLLTSVSHSYWHHTRIDPYRGSTLNRLLIQNCVTGCTAMLNRSLVNRLGTLPNNCVMHDAWISLVACCFGTIGVHPQPTILYRQHAANDTGAFSYTLPHILRSIGKRAFQERLLRHRLLKTKQAFQFLERYGTDLTCEQKETVSDFVSLSTVNRAKRLRLMLKRGFVRSGVLRNLQEIIF